MASSKQLPLYVGLKGKENGYSIIIIHKIDHWKKDNDEQILITSHDATVKSSKNSRITNPIDKYVSLTELKKSLMNKYTTYYALFRNKKNDYTSIYYQCKISPNEQTYIRKSRKTIWH